MERVIEIQRAKQRNYKKDIKHPEERDREQGHKKIFLGDFDLKHSNAFRLIKDRFHPGKDEPMYKQDLVLLCYVINGYVEPPAYMEYGRGHYRSQVCSYKWIDDILQTDGDKVMFVLNNLRFRYD